MSMNKISNKMLASIVFIVNLYMISLFAMTPYFNWKYANEHGFVKWLYFGEVVATAKSVVWPYFIFFNRKSPPPISPDEQHYVNSKKACDEAMKIIVKAGDVSRLVAADKPKIVHLLEVAITEADKVSPDYLRKVHSKFPEMYEQNYKKAMSLLINGFKADDASLVLAGVYGYNEFADWMQQFKGKKWDSKVTEDKPLS